MDCEKERLVPRECVLDRIGIEISNGLPTLIPMARLPLPPLLAAALEAGAWGVHCVYPVILWHYPALWWGGIFLIIANPLIAFSSMALFARNKTTLNPKGLPTALIVAGAFRFTRNPLYVNLTLLLLGLFFVSASPYFLIPPIVFVAVMDRFVIPREEHNLREKFGAQYEDYCRKVRRWI